MVQSFFARIQENLISTITFLFGMVLFFHFGENSSDVSILEFLGSNVWSIWDGSMYLQDPAAQSWSPFIGLFYNILPKWLSFSASVRVFNFLLISIVILLRQMDKIGLVVFMMIPAFILPQDDVIGLLCLALYLYCIDRGENKLSLSTNVLFLLLAFFVVKVFVFAALWVAIRDWRARIIALSAVLFYCSYQFVFNGHIMFLNDDINNQVFIENSVNLFTGLTYLGLPYGRIIFSIIFVTFSVLLIFSRVKDEKTVLADWLLLFFASFYYWSPEYLIWLLPLLSSFESNEKKMLYIVGFLAWVYNFLRGAYIRDWIDLPFGLDILNIVIGLIIGFLLIYVFNNRFRRHIITQ